MVRKRLSDITNSSQGANKIPSEDPKPLLFSTEIKKEYVDKLIQVRSYVGSDQFLGSTILGVIISDISSFFP